MTDSRSHGIGMPSEPDSAMTPMRMLTEGTTVKAMLEVMALCIFFLSIPIFTPSR